jgi:hypothetical protein
MCFCPSDRDKVWVRLYEQHKGKIDTNFGKLAFSTPPIAAYHSLDAKFTTTDMAKDLKTWALFGAPLGRSWQPTLEERRRYPEIQPLVSNPWTILHTAPPSSESKTLLAAVDLHNPNKSSFQIGEQQDDERNRRRREEERAQISKPAWHGTLLPKTDADTWLAAGFAGYERIVARYNSLKDKNEGRGNKTLTSADRDRLAVELNAYRSRYLAGARAGADVPLAKTHSDVSQSDWYNVAVGKGVLVLHELRHLLGHAKFEQVMDDFGREYAGKEVTSAEFQSHVERASGTSLAAFFDYWLGHDGLPSVRLEKVSVSAKGDKGYTIVGEIAYEAGPPEGTVEVAIETAHGNEFKTVKLTGLRTPFSLDSKDRPSRVVCDPYSGTPKANGGVYTVTSWQGELEKALIVYGTVDEAANNREAAEELQKAIIQQWSNFTVPIKSDTEVTDEDVKSHHLLLIGRPDTNKVTRRFENAFPIRFGPRSFVVRDEAYAHANSGVAVAGENPLNGRYSLVAIAGMSPESTLRNAPQILHRGMAGAQVLIFPNKARAKSVVVPPAELVKRLERSDEITRQKDNRVSGGQ